MNYFFQNIPEDGFTIFVVALGVAFVLYFLTRRLFRVPVTYFIFSLIGLLLGLLVGSLAAGFFRQLPGAYGQWLPLIVQAFLTIVVFDFFVTQSRKVSDVTSVIYQRLLAFAYPEERKEGRELVLDTSSLIDGRISEVIETGFITDKLIVPRFVLNELQNVADSADPIKRAKGRRGLEVLTDLQKHPKVGFAVIEDNPTRTDKVDEKLVKVAKSRRARIITSDYNLNKVASISGVMVLNVNELANSLRPAVVPGESLLVRVIQKGKGRGQGVGFLPDGTMIVVEEGSQYVGKDIDTEVERIFQTAAGKMIFVRPKD